MKGKYMPPKFNPIFTNIVIRKIYEYCDDHGYQLHTYNAEFDDIWFVATTKSGTQLVFIMDSDTFEVTLKK